MNAVVVKFETGAGELLALMSAVAKVFSTGSRGYYANGKVEIDGKRYQVQVQLVEIGSKNSPK